MKKKLIKSLLLIMGFMFSPIVLAVITGFLFILWKLLIGSNLSGAFQSLKIIIDSIIPFLPYITVLPAVIFLLAILFKNKDRITNRF